MTRFGKIQRPLWTGNQPIMLASRSPVRRSLLQNAGIHVECLLIELNERVFATSILARRPDGEQVSRYLALAKATAASARCPGRIVLGADQVLAAEAAFLSKPTTRSQARAQLERLSGARHTLTSSAVIVRDGKPVFEVSDMAIMKVRFLSDAFIDAYLDTVAGNAFSAVGAYQAEGIGIYLFEWMRGHQATILRLPLIPLLSCFRSMGLVVG